MIEYAMMSESDIDDIADFEKECFTIPWSRNSFTDELNNSLAVYFVARDGGHTVGYCGFWNVAGEGDITNVAVKPSYQGCGIGSRLIENMIKTAHEMKLSLLTLEVRESNTAAKNLYAKYGFVKLGIRKKYYRDTMEDAWIMTKELS